MRSVECEAGAIYRIAGLWRYRQILGSPRLPQMDPSVRRSDAKHLSERGEIVGLFWGDEQGG